MQTVCLNVGRIDNPSRHQADLRDGLSIRPTEKPAIVLSPSLNVELRPVLLRCNAAGEEVPALVLLPKPWNKRAVVWVSPRGKQSLLSSETRSKLRSPIERLLEAGTAVVGIDLFGQGEFTPDGKPMSRNRLNRGAGGTWASSACYTYGYNYPLAAERVHDILSAISFVRHSLKAEKVDLVGLSGAGHWVALARAQAGAQIDRAVIDTAGFRFAKLTAIDDPDFLPGGAKYLDLPGILALSAPCPLWLAGEGHAGPPVVAAAYRAAGAGGGPNSFRWAGAGSRICAAVRWLTAP